MSWVGQAVRILRKDLQIEWRGKARAFALATFAGILLLLFSFAIGPDTKMLQKHAAAYIWLAVLTASTLSLAQSFRTETEHGALEGLRLLPIDSRGLYYGKALANWLVLVGLTGLLMPLSFILFDLSLSESPLKLVAVLLLGCGGIAAPGTMYSALTARTGAQQLMLPVLLFPLLVPALLAAVKALGFVLLGDPMDQIGSWLTLLLCFDLVFWSLGGVLFGYLIEQ
ncbi:MAG: transcriptional regulator [Proteobacteria bacterium]|nr:transcriptional regulator [Pseudomonadota bacterium]MCP4917483.1 transcriptional regulator [Pseudomonadota bacterium]